MCENLFLSPQPLHCEHAYSCLEVVVFLHITITIHWYTKDMPQGTRDAVCGTAAPTHPLFGGVSGHHVGQVLLLQLRLLLAHRLLVLGLHGCRVQVELLRVQGHLHPLHRAPLLRALLSGLHLQPWSQITNAARRLRVLTRMQQLVRLLVRVCNQTVRLLVQVCNQTVRLLVQVSNSCQLHRMITPSSLRHHSVIS